MLVARIVDDRSPAHLRIADFFKRLWRLTSCSIVALYVWKVKIKLRTIDVGGSKKPEIWLPWITIAKFYCYRLWAQFKLESELLYIESALPLTVNYTLSPLCGVSAYGRAEVIIREAGANMAWRHSCRQEATRCSALKQLTAWLLESVDCGWA